jgi:hypothetical protein
VIDSERVGSGGLAPRRSDLPAPLSEREIANRYMGRIKRAIEVLHDAYGHGDAPYEPAALNALHILRGIDEPTPASGTPGDPE